MDTSPRKSTWVIALRKPFYAAEKFLPGKFNPNIWTVAMIGSSILFTLLWQNKWIGILLIVISMIFDWLDGAYARKQNSTSQQGHIIDISFDKISEIIILTPFIGSWFSFAILPCILANLYFTKRIFTTNQHFHINVRFITIIYILFFT